MSLLSRLWTPPSRSEARVFDSSIIPLPGQQDIVLDSTGRMSQFRALQLISVFGCVRLLSDSIASLPIDVYQRVDGQQQQVVPTPSVITQPFPRIDIFEWLWMMISSLALQGNSYHYIAARNQLMYPTQLLPVHPDCMRVEWNRDSFATRYWVEGVPVDPADIVHIRRFPLTGTPIGLSPIGAARVGIEIGLGADSYGNRYFQDAANPSSVLETDQDLDETGARHLQQQWISTHGGRRLPAVLSGGVKWRAISIPPEDAQFLGTRQFQRGEIAMLYGIPPHMIGDTQKSTSWGSGIEQQSIGYVKFTLQPWLVCIEQALSALLPRGQYVKFNVDALLRGDQKTRYDSYTQARNAGWISINEIREKEDLPPIGPVGDEYIQPLNMGPLGFNPRDSSSTGGQ